jgi:integrase
MRSRNGEFGIFPRRSRKTVFYYYWLYDETGKRKFRSTGKKNYEDALRYCRNLQIKGRLYIGTSFSFDKYTENFFDFDKCPYINNRLLRGFSYGRTWAKRQRSLLQKVIQPHFKDTDIRNISKKMVDDFLLSLRPIITGNKTLNHILTTVKAVFSYAHGIGVIETNPTEGIKPFKIAIQEKGIFTRDELALLFNNPGKSDIWAKPVHFLINSIAASTGMRLGEVLALKPENIMENSIIIEHSWNCLDGLKSTKSGKTRAVPISFELAKALNNFITINNVCGYIFSSNNGKTPINHKAVYKHFWNTLFKIGISAELRKSRNISFHSYRHTFNTMLLEEGLNPETIRLLTGHSTANMTARYSHIRLNNMPEIIGKLPMINNFSNIQITYQ